MFNRLKFYVAGALALTLASCETDLKVNADYTQTAVVYGVMNSADTIHIFKLSKTFLGNGNALDMAKVADSSKANLTEMPVIERLVYNTSSNTYDVVRTYTVRDTVIDGKPSGTFYSGADRYFYFVDPLLTPSPNVAYRLRFKLNNVMIDAKTFILGKSGQVSPSTQNSSFELIKNDIRVTGPQYSNVLFKVNSGENVKRVEAKIKFTYVEHYNDGKAPETKIITIGNEKLVAVDSKVRELMNRAFDAKALMDQINTQVGLPAANVKQREIRDLGIYMTSAGEDLNTYIEVNNPVSGVLQERPEYTNVNNGIGIWSSNYTQQSIQPVGDKTTIMLTYGEAFLNHKFCTNRGVLNPTDPKRCQP